jgi:hypothetical protein
MTRPSSQIEPSFVMKSLIGIDFILAIAALASSVPAG